MPMDQEDQVATGLVAPQAPAPKSTTDTAAVAVTEAAPVASADVPLVQVAGLGEDLTKKVEEVNQPAAAVAAPTQDFTADDQLHAESDNLQRDFMARIAAARAPDPKPYTPPAVPERIAEQTRLEMEAGRRRVEEFAALEASRPKRAPQTDGSMTPVFRPEDFVPNQKKGQGNLAGASARTL
jgi:hypothetical protein